MLSVDKDTILSNAS